MTRWSYDRERGNMLRAVNSVPFQTGLSLARTTPRMATSGALTMGVKLVPPMQPRLEMVNVRPAMSDGPSLLSRALADMDMTSRDSSTTLLATAASTTGTTR